MIKNRKKYKLNNLLLNTPEAYYWVGFIMADGCIHWTIYKRKNKDYKYLNLKLSLHSNHLKTIEMFAKFINAENKNFYFEKDSKMVTISVLDTKTLYKIKDKFDFKYRKTYNPPTKLNIKNNNLFTAFLIGYIDGDGCIRKIGKKSLCLEVVAYKNWKNTFKKWFSRLYKLSGGDKKINNLTRTAPKIFVPKKYNITTVHLQCSNPKILLFLKNKTMELKLPVLKRKWDKINEGYTDKYSKSFYLKKYIIKLLKDNKSYKEICKELLISKSYVSIIWKKYVNKTKKRKTRVDYPERGKNGKFIKN